MEAHERLGHPNKDATRDMVKGLGVTVKPGVMGVCWARRVAKAKQKNVVQFSLHQRSIVPGERVFVDISSIKPPKDCQQFQELIGGLLSMNVLTSKSLIFSKEKTKWLKRPVNC